MRRGLLVAAVAIMALAGCAGSSSRSAPATTVPAASSGATGSGPETLEAKVAREIREQGLTPERAMLQFSLVLGPLPGVEVPSGPREQGVDANPAIVDLYRVWDQLTPEVRREANRLMGAPTGDPPAGVDVTASSTAPETTTHPSSFSSTGVVPMARPISDPAPPIDFQALVDAANAQLSKVLGVPPMDHIDVTPERSAAEENAITAIYQRDWWGLSWTTLPHCLIKPNLNMLGSADPVRTQSIITHEVFHCYQFRQAGSGPVQVSVNLWMQEGEATWASQVIAPTELGDNYADGRWRVYAFSPKEVYSDRADDAVGIFGHLGEVIGDQGAVWPRLLPAYVAAEGGNDAGAFDLLLGGDRATFFDSWGSSYYLDASSKEWNQGGPGPARPGPGVPPDTVTVAPDASTDVPSAGPSQAELAQLDTSQVDVVTISSLSGYGRVRDASGFDSSISNAGEVTLCVKDGGCTCPDSSDGSDYTFVDATAPIQLGLTGGDTTALTTVSGVSLDAFCQHPDSHQPHEPTPAPSAGSGSGSGGGGSGNGGGGNGNGGGGNGNGGGNGSGGNGSGNGNGNGNGNGGGGSGHNGGGSAPGSSSGDPHLTTFDGRLYDLQTVGEYVLTRSTTDDFTVQVRQEPVTDSRQASVNTAAAVAIGGHRAVVSLEGGKAVLRVDGGLVDGAEARVPGLRATRSATTFGMAYRVTLDDGTFIQVDPVGQYALTVAVSVADGRKGKLTGLLGNDNGNPIDDLVLPNGSAYPEFPPIAAVHQLADAWRVSADRSAFDYQAGKHAGSYDDPTFPDPPGSGAAPDTSSAEAACRDHGIVDEALLKSCVYDVSTTHRPVLAGAYSRRQRALTGEALLGQSTLTPHVFAGTLTTKDQQIKETFPASAGDIGFIGTGDTLCSGAGENVAVEIDKPDGSVQTIQAACGIGRIDFTATGTYTISFAVLGDVPDTYQVPLLTVRPDKQADITSPAVLAGTIDQLGAHDVYRFGAHAGDHVTLTGPACTAAGLMIGIDNPDGSTLANATPCQDHEPTAIPADGTYTLVVNALNGGPASYQVPFSAG